MGPTQQRRPLAAPMSSSAVGAEVGPRVVADERYDDRIPWQQRRNVNDPKDAQRGDQPLWIRAPHALWVWPVGTTDLWPFGGPVRSATHRINALSRLLLCLLGHGRGVALLGLSDALLTQRLFSSSYSIQPELSTSIESNSPSTSFFGASYPRAATARRSLASGFR